MYYVYVIRSLQDRSFYVGYTSDLLRRLDFHYSVQKNKGVTRLKIPWEYYYFMEVPNTTIASRIETHIKRMKSRKYIQNLKKYPEIGARLIEKYS